MPSLLGIDSGLTITKAVIFDIDGTPLAVARRRIAQLMPHPRHVERDMDALWSATAAAISEAIIASGRPASDIKAIAPTAHGDGLFPLDAQKRPLGKAILSLDSRAGQIANDWNKAETGARSLDLTGQMPHASAPSAILFWLKQHEPERYHAIAHILTAKDWLRFCLTETLGTDLTEASTSFTDVRTQAYANEALAIFGLEAKHDALVPFVRPDTIIGGVTRKAAHLTGLIEGTPVVAGLHDVTASSLGMGGLHEGVVAMIAGTFSINETVSSAPRMDPRWMCRSSIVPGQWNNMAISPASTANYDWFLDTLCGTERASADAAGQSIHALLAPEIDAALSHPSTILFHPYLFGSPYGSGASASLFGLRGWNDRGDVLRAVLEGIVFNHKIHVDALRQGFDLQQARLTGGISRSGRFVQMFADALGIPVTVTDTDESAAWGAAMCAGAGIGLYRDAYCDPRDLASISTTYEPDPARSQHYQDRFSLFSEIAAAMAPLWPKIDALIPAQA